MSTGPGPASTSVCALSVNLNLIAQIRNRRNLPFPDLLRAATTALQAGAQGLTIHPRPDERHVRDGDVDALAAFMRDWPQAELNIEGNPQHNLMAILERLAARGQAPHQVTFVPDSQGQATSDHGWSLPAQAAALAPLVARAKALGVRVSLFMDPDPVQIPAVRELGADRIELYTEGWARAHGTSRQAQVLACHVATAQAAARCGLGVNAGHDLSRANLPDFLAAVPGVCEVSIGHALVCEALEVGLEAAVRAYRACVSGARSSPSAALTG